VINAPNRLCKWIFLSCTQLNLVYLPISNKKGIFITTLTDLRVFKCIPRLVNHVCSRLATAWVSCYHVCSRRGSRTRRAGYSEWRDDAVVVGCRITRLIKASNSKKSGAGNIRESLLLKVATTSDFRRLRFPCLLGRVPLTIVAFNITPTSDPKSNHSLYPHSLHHSRHPQS